MGRPKKTAVSVEPVGTREVSAEGELRFSSGCYPLDIVLGGGYVCGRILNVYGESATGKSFLAAQAVAEFVKSFEDAFVLYIDAEQTFSEDFADRVGCPLRDENRFLILNDVTTLQKLYQTLFSLQDSYLKQRRPVLVVVDSLDSFTDESELTEEANLSGYQTAKAKYMSSRILPLITSLSGKYGNLLTFYIISQARSNLTPYGPKDIRSGGRAIKFYCSQILHTSKQDIKKTVFGQDIPIGMNITVRIEKNKCGLWGTSVVVPVYFSKGINNNQACALFLSSLGKKDLVNELMERWKALMVAKATSEAFQEVEVSLREASLQRWREFEAALAERISSDPALLG